MALAERLHLDEDTILAWSWDKLQRWIAYDEVMYMINQVHDSMKDGSVDDAVAIVRQEQECNGWRGVYRMGGAVSDE